MPTKKRAIAIDYGTERIGLALSHASLAEPLTVIPSDTQAMLYISRLIKQHHVTDVVVGVSEGTMEEKSRIFGEQLKKVTGKPVHYVDETLSSKNVLKKLAQAGKTLPDKAPIDHYAAAEFLQEWLDEHYVPFVNSV